MAYLLALTVALLLIVIFYLKIRTIRDEREEMLKLLILISSLILMVKYFISDINSHVDLLFSATSSLCLVSISSLYIRNVALENRTSIYLFLLALFPFILFYVFFLLFNIYSSQITDGMIYDFLGFFYQNSTTVLFSISLIYDIYILWPIANGIHRLSLSMDGQLAVFFFAVKVLFFCVFFSRGLFIDANLYFKFPESAFTIMICLGIYHYRYFHFLKIYFGYLFKLNAMGKLYQEEQSIIEKSEFMFYLSTVDQLIDKEQLFKNPDLKLSDVKKFMSISEGAFKNLSKKYKKACFDNYLNRKRINYFLECLSFANNDVSIINKLLFDSGFKNDHEFNRFFKKQMGCTVWQYVESRKINIYRSSLSSTFK